MDHEIRLIQKEDNTELNKIIKDILIELDCTTSEYLSDSSELADLYTQYNTEGAKFWVVIDKNSKKMLGGAGYAEVEEDNSNEKICELQKMYLLKESRGKGLARILYGKIIDNAKKDGYKKIYIETMSQMTDAIKFYEKNGFTYINRRLGKTGHNCCDIFMIKNI